ncbi:polysaccharide deacetylase [Rariglobus hedericola]|uniref:Polysaccharide deacetylase n=3 Tax=Rariglobus hedericola TaxID=2597822 RepID=A0A556QSC2_9BACT|nr:polysaccharide deacetylase [Rariglobus hedericola]
MPHFMRLFCSAFLFCAAVSAAVAASILPNGGFEEGLTGWVTRDAMSQVSPEAAHTGKGGLRVTDADAQKGSDLTSAKLPVVAGQALALSFSARAQGDFCGVYLWFHDAAGKPVKDEAKKYTGGMPSVGVKKGAGEWTPYTLKAIVPEGAATVAVWVHSWGTAMGTADFDDFELAGVAGDARPIIGVQPVVTANAAAATLPELPARKAPPVIILKLDDLRQIDGKVHASWIKIADYLKNRNIKVSFGIIAQTLGEATPAYTQWIKDRQASGEIEFWFHGFDHAVWTNEAGKKLSEFGGRGFDEQWSRFERSQKLAKEKLGFEFATFGPGGGGALHQDADTAEVMARDPAMKVWLYPSPIDASGRKLAAGGKVTILDRVWAVNLEAAVGNPNFQRFVEGYAKNPGRDYFVLQGHPTHWAGARFDEFVKIIDFLVAQKAVFMTPSGYAASLGGKPAQQEGGGK